MEIADFKLSKKVQDRLKDKIFLKKAFAEGKTGQEILEISDDMMAKFYQVARHLFENHRYETSANVFLFLVTLNAHQSEYWLGLGMATQMGGNFEAAIDAYEMAAIYECENPVPYFYLAKCLFAIHERQSAIQALEIAIQYADSFSEYQELKQQATEALKLLNSTNSLFSHEEEN